MPEVGIACVHWTLDARGRGLPVCAGHQMREAGGKSVRGLNSSKTSKVSSGFVKDPDASALDIISAFSNCLLSVCIGYTANSNLTDFELPAVFFLGNFYIISLVL